MCGLCGILCLDDHQQVDLHGLVAMRDTMIHRGPDGAGVWTSPNRKVGLAHRRLSIIDLSDAASQPMGTADGLVQLVFNGEVYNHAALRQDLIAEGAGPWITDHSDTEVLLHGYLHWGIDVIERLDGMFGIAIWDGRSEDLWLVRDRRGIKPLYWTRQNGRILFGSEIKAIIEDRRIPRAIDEEALYHYLSFLTTPAPQTLFKGIRKIPDGCLVRVDRNGDVHERRWYELWDHVQPATERSDAEIADRVLSELKDSVVARKESDVPVGVFLSGGIDSSTNAALFSGDRESVVKTFCIGYEDSDTYTNETHFARQMADIVGAEHHELLLTQQDLIDFIPRMIELQDEPIADPVCVPVYFVSKLARDNGVIVAQVGEGADELFWGYESWRTFLRLAKLNALPIPRLAKKAVLSVLRATDRNRSLQYELLRRGAHGEPVFWSGAEAFQEAEKQQLLGSDLRATLGDLTSWDAISPIRQRFEAGAWEKSHLAWMSFADLSLRLPELLLMRVDKMSMGVSLEGRVPFLDHRFVEYAMGISQAVKTRGNISKSILKRAVRGTIPDNLIDRRKQGFGVPVHEWFFSDLGHEVRRAIDRFVSETGLLNAAAVDRVLKEGRGTQGWYLYNLAAWWERYIEGSGR
jgi:asparagine synthase (glutamine-hydrolysing)